MSYAAVAVCTRAALRAIVRHEHRGLASTVAVPIYKLTEYRCLRYLHLPRGVAQPWEHAEALPCPGGGYSRARDEARRGLDDADKSLGSSLL